MRVVRGAIAPRPQRTTLDRVRSSECAGLEHGSDIGIKRLIASGGATSGLFRPTFWFIDKTIPRFERVAVDTG